MAKYTLLKNKVTGDRSVRINDTGEVVIEVCDRARYAELRKKALNSLNRQAKNDAYASVGMKRVKGSLGGTYWE